MAYNNRKLVLRGLEGVLLRCVKCERKTYHVLLSTIYTLSNKEIEENYECQECGETKKIYEIAFRLPIPSHKKLTSPTIEGLRVRA